MKKILFTMAAALLLASCGTTQNVKYVEAQRYFINNDAPATGNIIKVTTQQDFDRYFGMATVMGKNGQPTPVDFSKEFVIAVTVPETDTDTELSPVSLRKTGDKQLTLTYTIKRGEKMSYTIKPMFMLKVSNAYAGYDIVGNRLVK